jgi:hypothetical protein
MKLAYRALTLAALLSSSAAVAGTTQLNVLFTNGSGGFTPYAFQYYVDGSSHYYPEMILSDGTNLLGTSANPIYAQFGTAQAVTVAGIPAGTSMSGVTGFPDMYEVVSGDQSYSTGGENFPTIDIYGDVRVSIVRQAALPAGTNAIGAVSLQPVAGNGATPKVLPALTNSAVSVKSSAGTVFIAHCDNGNSATVYLELFNTSSVSLGSTTPTWFVPISANGGGESSAVGVALGGTAIYAAAVTAYNGATGPSTTLNCSIGYE